MSVPSVLPRSLRRSGRAGALAIVWTVAVVGVAAAVTGAACGPPPAARAAERRLQAGDVAGAQALVDRALERSPRDRHLWHARLRVHLARHDATEAVRAYRRWRALDGEEDREAVGLLALETLRSALSAPTPEVRAAAIRAAERLNQEELFDEVTRLMADVDAVVAATASVAVLRGHPDAPAVLTRALASDVAEARAVAVAGLARKLGVLARDDLHAALGDPHPAVRDAACGAVARFADEVDAAVLIRLARRDPAGPVRAAALRALAQARRRDGLAAGRAALADPYLGARLAAVELLGRLLPRGQVGAALGPLVRGRDPFVALRAAARLGGGPDGIAALRAALTARSWTVRAAGIAAARAIAGAGARRLVAPLAADPQPAVRRAAARALLDLGDTARARGVLRGVLGLPDEALRLDAAVDLVRLGDEAGRRELHRLLRHGRPPTRLAVVGALPSAGKLPDPLLDALADPAALVRVAAAEALLGWP